MCSQILIASIRSHRANAVEELQVEPVQDKDVIRELGVCTPTSGAEALDTATMAAVEWLESVGYKYNRG